MLQDKKVEAAGLRGGLNPAVIALMYYPYYM